MDITLKSYLNDTTLHGQDVVQLYLDKAKTLNADYFSFVRFHDDYVAAHVGEFASRPLKSAPIAIKDIILTQNFVTSC